MTNPICIDISHWQPDPDWAALQANGTQAVILKCTEGTTYIDPTYGKRLAKLRSMDGMSVAPYHFLKHGDVKTQMQSFVKNARMQDGDRLVIDYEDSACTLSDLTTAVQYLLDSTKCEITVYGGNLLKTQLGSTKNEFLAANTSLWLAQYTTGTPSWPKATWPYWSLWQYSEKETIKGLSVVCDANKWNGDPSKLAGWFHKEQAPPSGQVVSVTAPEGVTVTVNGKPVT